MVWLRVTHLMVSHRRDRVPWLADSETGGRCLDLRVHPILLGLGSKLRESGLTVIHGSILENPIIRMLAPALRQYRPRLNKVRHRKLTRSISPSPPMVFDDPVRKNRI